jgi:hypothetical protein
MGKKVGLSCKLYRNTGTYAVPVWSEIDLARDVTLSLEVGEADASTRASTWREFLQTLKEAGIEFELASDSSDTEFTAVKDAFFDNTAIEILALDGDEAVAGSQGLRMTSIVSSFSRNEPLEETVTISVTIKPTPNDDAEPEWFTAV